MAAEKNLLTALMALFMIIPAGCGSDLETLKINEENIPVCGWRKSYVIRDTSACVRAKYGCPEGSSVFMDSGGCGCMEPEYCKDKSGENSDSHR